MSATIAIVDDSPDDVEFLRLAMSAEQLPIQIVHFIDAETARLYLTDPSNSKAVRLVITDHRGIAPGDPTSAIEEIRSAATGNGVGVVVMSNGLHPDAQSKLRAIGIKDVWDKPLDFEGFVELVHRIDSFIK